MCFVCVLLPHLSAFGLFFLFNVQLITLLNPLFIDGPKTMVAYDINRFLRGIFYLI